MLFMTSLILRCAILSSYPLLQMKGIDNMQYNIETFIVEHSSILFLLILQTFQRKTR